MADENLKDFTVNWLLTGLFMFCLIAFAVTFMYNNNPTGLGTDADNKLGGTYTSLSGNLLSSPNSANEMLNDTASTNPEASQLGSRDIVSTGFKSKNSASAYWESSKNLLSWVFSGTTGKMLLAVFGGLIGILFTFYLIKLIRIGT